ncbi:MAG TPA: hypothetical protein VFK92_11540 [Burkholderiales bacterium]|nr:hypothetical protein [Burkholderiales bacterium]
MTLEIPRYFFALFLAVAAAGCVAPGVKISGDSAALDTSPKPGEGFVAFKVVTTRPMSALRGKWTGAIVEIKSTGTTVELVDFGDRASPGSLFFARLDQGEYQIKQLQSIGPGGGLLVTVAMSDYEDMRAHIGTFAVKSGSLTNLGTIVIAPGESGKPSTVEYLAGEIGRKSVTEDLEVRTKQKLALPQISGPKGGMSAADEEKALARSRGRVSILTAGDDAQRSPVFGGATLGQIVTRDARGSWQALFLDSLEDVTYARRLADGTLIAGLPQARYAVRKPGQPWKVLALPNVSGRILHVDTTESGALFVVAGAESISVVYRASLDQDNSETRVLTTLSPPLVQSLIVPLDDRLVLLQNIPGFSRTAEVRIVDKKSLEVKTANYDFWVRSWYRLPSGLLFVSRVNGLSTYVSTSRDNGVTWVHTEGVGPSSIYFMDERKGYGTDWIPGAISPTTRLTKSGDGGKTWEATGVELDAAGGRVVWASPQEVIVAGGFQLFSTADEGKSWKRILPREAN